VSRILRKSNLSRHIFDHVGPARCNLIGRSMVAPPPVLSPNSILLLLHLVANSLAQGKIGRTFCEFCYFNFLFLLIAHLKQCNLKLFQWQNVGNKFVRSYKNVNLVI
jgi:hypothetical protein